MYSGWLGGKNNLCTFLCLVRLEEGLKHLLRAVYVFICLSNVTL